MTAHKLIAASLAEVATEPDARAKTLQLFGPLAFAVILMYVIMIRPEQKKRRELMDRLNSLKSGDKIQTTSGIIGVVVTVKDKSITVRSADTKLEIVKSSVSEILEKSTSSEAQS